MRAGSSEGPKSHERTTVCIRPQRHGEGRHAFGAATAAASEAADQAKQVDSCGGTVRAHRGVADSEHRRQKRFNEQHGGDSLYRGRSRAKPAGLNRRMRKTACPVVWEGWRAQSRQPDPIDMRSGPCCTDCGQPSHAAQ